MEAEPLEYKVEIIKSDIPQIQIIPVAKQNVEELERASILSPVLLQLLRSPLYKDWLVPDDDPNMAKCKLCGDNSYIMDENILQNHMKTKRHMINKELKERKATCRTCLLHIPSKDATSLFKLEPTKGCTYDEIVYSVTGIQVMKEEQPAYLCLGCRRRALQAYNFQLRAQRADAFLKECPTSKGEPVFQSNNDVESNIQKNDVNKFTKKEVEEVVHEAIVLSDDSMGEDRSYEQLPSHYNNSVKEVAASTSKSKRIAQVASSTSNSNTQFASRKCLTCNNTFATVRVLMRHMQYCKKKRDTPAHVPKPHVRRPNECRLCYKSFSNALVLLNHIKMTHRSIAGGRSKPRANTQPNEIKRMPIRKAIEKREKTPPPETPTLRCGVCSSLFQTEQELDTHCREHGNTEVIMCGVCERVYFKYSQFKRHFNVHHPEMEAIVKAETTETLLEVNPEVMPQILQHVLMTSIGDLITANILPSDEPVEIEAFVQVCGLCGCVILSPEDLEAHNQTEHPDYNMRCTLCGMLFVKEQLLKVHMNRCQKLEKKLECLVCGQKMYVEHQLTMHMSLRHREVKKRREFICGICSQSFRLESQLNSHTAACEPECEVQCETCHKVFKKKFFLDRHVRNFHKRDELSSQWSFLCSYCGKGFSRNGQLKRHLYTHTGEKPFKCSVEGCDKGFNTSDACMYHVRKHKGIDSLMCPHCSRCFYKPNVFRTHMMIHTGERPYKCNQCDAAFIQRPCLVQHMKKHSNIEPSLVLDPNPFKKRNRRRSRKLDMGHIGGYE